MFANPKFSGRKTPQFKSSFIFDVEHERGSIPYIKAHIVNDCDYPSKTLVSIDIFDIPHDAEGSLKDKYDFIAGVALLPEDTIKLARHLNVLVGAIFDDLNYRR